MKVDFAFQILIGSKNNPSIATDLYALWLYAADITCSSIFGSKITSFPCTHVRLAVYAGVSTAATGNNKF